MVNTGIKATKLIVKLQEMVKMYGDKEVFAGGTDYPEGVKSVYIKLNGDGYIPKGAFEIR